MNFESIENLDIHYKYISSKFQNDNLFLVGGCIRDILLGLETNPTDIDLACVGDPNKLYKKLDTKDCSHFITEKYGTITVIKDNINYELTPFRSEAEYTDNRHPDEVNWSKSLLQDASRRDFTVNSMYYFLAKLDKKITFPENAKNIPSLDKKAILDSLKKNGFLFVSSENLLILQDHNLIEQIFKEGKFDETILLYIIDTIKEYFIPPLIRGARGDSSLGNVRIIIDPNHGLQDLLNPKIKAIGDPNKRFQEDALRIVRALRFVSVWNEKIKTPFSKGGKGVFSGSFEEIPQPPLLKGESLFDISKETRIALKDNVSLVHNIANERIKDEITKAFQKGSAFTFVSLLDEIQLLEYIFPAVHKTKYVEQPVRYHPFDTYAHTLLTLYELERIANNSSHVIATKNHVIPAKAGISENSPERFLPSQEGQNTSYLLKLAMLYHDVGKPGQFAEYEDINSPEDRKKVLSSDLNHRKSSPSLAQKDLGNLKFSKKEIEEIKRYIAEHHTPGEILTAKVHNREKKVRKLYSKAGFDRVNNLLDITIADRKGQYNPLQNSSDISDIYELREILINLKEKEGQFTPKDMDIDGTIIMEEFNLEAGKEIGNLLEKAFNRVLSDIQNRNKKNLITEYLKGLMKN